jgi:hypothetical protein
VALSNTFWLNKPQSAQCARRKPQRWRGEYESILSPSVALLDRVANVEPGQRVRPVPIGGLSNSSKFASNNRSVVFATYIGS